MYRFLFACAFAAGCVDAPDEAELATAESAATGVTRTQVAGDVYHYEYVLRVGSTPNAEIHVHRIVREGAPWSPIRTHDATMMMSGDFATYTTNFALTPAGLAPWLAARNVDVWGMDRRWAHAPAGDHISDFDAMSLDQSLNDMGVALAFARGVRLVDGVTDQLNLVGFSRGGELAYFYASREATRPAALRHVKGIVPLDVYVSLAPEDEDLRQFFCTSAFYEYLDLDAGVTDTPNDFQITVGNLELTAPNDPNPWTDFFPPTFTNHRVFLAFAGKTYNFFPASPVYHLNAPNLVDNKPVSLRVSPEPVVATWMASAPPHQALREAADTDALTCGDAPPLDLPLSRIHVPLFLIGAAGGYGDHARYSTTQVGSTDVQTLVIRQLPVEDEAEDFGHADLLYSPEAEGLAWQPLLSWLRAH